MAGPIVVGTDGSESATVAVLEAIRLAKGLGEPLHIVSAYRPIGASAKGIPAEFDGMVGPAAKVDAILADAGARARTAGVEFTTHALEGDPANALIDTAEKLSADILVVGNKGLNSLKRFVLGSVPSKLIHSAPCTTHIVHTT